MSKTVSLPVAKPKRHKKPDYSNYNRSKRHVENEMLHKWVRDKWYRKAGVAAVNLLLSPSSNIREARIKNNMNPWTGLRKDFKDWNVNKMSKSTYRTWRKMGGK